MDKNKLLSLIERNAAEELQAYFASLPNGCPLDCHEEKVMLEHFCPAAVKSYINRFRFSESAEILFIGKAPADIRLAYLNYYGLREETQKHVINANLMDVIRDFVRLRHFDDVDYLLENGSNEAVRLYLSYNRLENDAQVEKLLRRDNPTLFAAYANKWYISENIKRLIFDERNLAAFRAVAYRFYRLYKKKAKQASDYGKLASSLTAETLPADLQAAILGSYNREFIELLLKTCPLAEPAQAALWKHNFDAEWLKLHVEHLYGLGGYRFTPENEKELFKRLAKKDLDECLTAFRQKDDVSFMQCASTAAAKKYIKNFWLSDDAQVATVNRGNGELISELISRYSPEHGMCWQAEVAMVELGAMDAVRQYISFHTMCWQALEKLKANFPQVAEEYYARHPY